MSPRTDHPVQPVDDAPWVAAGAEVDRRNDFGRARLSSQASGSRSWEITITS